MNDEEAKKLFSELQKAVDRVQLSPMHRCMGNCGKTLKLVPLQFTFSGGEWSMSSFTVELESPAGWARIYELRYKFGTEDPYKVICPECRKTHAI